MDIKQKPNESPWKFCPSCGTEGAIDLKESKLYVCSRCEFHFYQNIASAVGVFLLSPEGELLWIVRENDPRRGYLDLPGGFLDPGETLEEGARREVLEELGIEVCRLQYFASHPNTYPYRDVVYHTSDAFFIAHISNDDVSRIRIDREEVRSVEWHPLEHTPREQIAFESHRTALEELLQKKESLPEIRRY